MNKIADLRANPQNVTKYLQDPGMMDVLFSFIELQS